ncbi:MAG: hypothetical protein ACE37H_10145 [Phycisphaeraceae bacterium]
MIQQFNATRTLAGLSLALLAATPAHAVFVTPQMGGGQVAMMGGAPMKHLDVSFDGTSVSVHIDDTVGTPMLRPLTGTDEFDPAEPWGVLGDKAYNFQYGWNPSGFISLPTGAGIWVERLGQDAALEVYARPPATVPAYSVLFENDGDRWQWSGAMTHNVYAVQNPMQSNYSATYRVYIGDATTGDALPGYGSADVTLDFSANPVPEPATAFALAALLPLIGRRRSA